MEVDDKKKDGSFLRKIREIRKLTLEELSHKTDLSRSTIANLEANRSSYKDGKNIRDTTIKNLADGLKIKPDSLYYYFGYLPPNLRQIAKEAPVCFMKAMNKVYNEVTRPDLIDTEKSFFEESVKTINNVLGIPDDNKEVSPHP